MFKIEMILVNENIIGLKIIIYCVCLKLCIEYIFVIRVLFLII